MRQPFKRVLLAGALAAFGLAAGSASAQSDFPNKPIRLLLPIAAGSVTDVVLRAAAQPLSQRLGQQVVVDNRTGASGIVGAEACARATPDGYTVCAVYHSIMSYNPYTFDKLPYDPERDYAPVTNLFFVTEGLVVPASLPVQSVAELRTYAVKNPTGVNLGTLGEGSLQELFVSWLNREWKTSIVGIAYKGGGPIANALGAGEIQIGHLVGAGRAGRHARAGDRQAQCRVRERVSRSQVCRVHGDSLCRRRDRHAAGVRGVPQVRPRVCQNAGATGQAGQALILVSIPTHTGSGTQTRRQWPGWRGRSPSMTCAAWRGRPSRARCSISSRAGPRMS